MKLSKSWTTVTPLSKIIALILFVMLPFIGFYFGYQFKDQNVPVNKSEATKVSSIESPEEVTEKFYTWYSNCMENHFKNSQGKSPDENCPIESSVYVNKQLVDSIKTNKPSVFCAQNTPVSFTIDKAVTDNNKAIVKVHTIYASSGDNPITVSLDRNEQKWLISDIKCNL